MRTILTLIAFAATCAAADFGLSDKLDAERAKREAVVIAKPDTVALETLSRRHAVAAANLEAAKAGLDADSQLSMDKAILYHKKEEARINAQIDAALAQAKVAEAAEDKKMRDAIAAEAKKLYPAEVKPK